MEEEQKELKPSRRKFLAGLGILGAAALTTGFNLQSETKNQLDVEALRQSIAEQNSQITKLAKDLENDPENQEIQASIFKLAEKRSDGIADLIVEKPDWVRELLLPEEVLSTLGPIKESEASWVTLVEPPAPVEAEGLYVLYHIDYRDGRGRYAHTLENPQTRVNEYELFSDNREISFNTFRSGERILATGYPIGRVMLVDSLSKV